MAQRLAALLILCSGAANGAGAQSRPARTRVPDSSPQYTLTVHLVPDAHRLEVSGTVRLAAADTARSAIALSLSERMADLRIEIVEPDASAGPAIVERVDSSGRSVKWMVRPSVAFAPGRPIILRFSYAGGGEVATMYYVGPEVAFASAWGSDWYPLPVSAVDKGTAALTVSVPAGWVVVTGGARRSTDGEEAQGTFRFAIRHPTYLSFTAGKYTVVRQAGPVPLSAYLLTPRAHIGPYLQGVEGIVHALTTEFGSLPFESLALVEVPRDLAVRAGFNAVSTAGLLVLNSRAFDAPDTKYLLEWLGHELSHQWFPQAVALRTPPGLYMEEALAEYGGLRAVETIAGPVAAEKFRRTGFEFDPIYSALAYFKLVGSGVDQPLANLQPKFEHRNLAYNKGFLVFDMLSRELGRATFQRALHEITQQHRFQSITWREFLDGIQHRSGRKLDWFAEQWFQRTGAPDFRLSWSQAGDTLHGVISQPEPYYRTRLKVELQDSEGQRLIHVVETAGARTAFVLAVRFRVNSAILDPNFEVLRWTPEFRAAADSVRSAQPRGG